MKQPNKLKSCLVATGVSLALAAGAALAQSGTSQPAEAPPTATATPPTAAPPPDQQATTPVPNTPAGSTSVPTPQSPATPTDRPPMATATSPTQIATFQDLDLNKDSGLTKDEVIGDQTLSNSFATYDTNGDGKLSQEEFAKYKSSKQLGRAKSDEPDPNKR